MIETNEFKLDGNVKLKQGLKQMISQAWQKHRREQLLTSNGKRSIRDVLIADWKAEMQSYQNEVFVTELRLPNPLVTEVYTLH